MPFTPAPTGPSHPVAVPVELHPRRRSGSADRPSAFSIDCGVCAHRGTTVCDDCVVTFIVGREADDAVVVDAAEARAVRMLEQAGLVPGVRHSSRAG